MMKIEHIKYMNNRIIDYKFMYIKNNATYDREIDKLIQKL